MSNDRASRYYTHYAEREWQRLAPGSEGAIEFELTCRTLARYLGNANSILDIGGGPGRYAQWLANRGHDVVLAEPVQALLDIARDKAASAGLSSLAEQMCTADVRDLTTWPAGSFDVVLCLGPFYHLQQAADRQRACAELIRVVKPGGRVFVATMTPAALLRRTFALPTEWHHLDDAEWLGNLEHQGVFNNDQPGRFDGAFALSPDAAHTMLTTAGFTLHETLGVESLALGLHDTFAAMARQRPKTYARALNLLERHAKDPDILGLCSHLLHVVSRPQAL